MEFHEFYSSGYRITEVVNDSIEVFGFNGNNICSVADDVEPVFEVTCNIADITNTKRFRVMMLVDGEVTKYFIKRASPDTFKTLQIKRSSVETIKSAINFKIAANKLTIGK